MRGYNSTFYSLAAWANGRVEPLFPIRVVQFLSSRFARLSVPAILVMAVPSALATDIEPRAYSNIPVGLNFLVAGYGYTKGNVTFAPSVPIENGKIEIHSTVLAYVRSLDLWGKSGKVDIILPQAWLSGQAEVLGQERSREISGFADPIFRLYVNLFGAPALSAKEFADYKQDTIIGASLAISPPAGQYDPQKLVTLGTNRWTVKPEIGISKAWGTLIAEFAAGVFVFTDNDQPFLANTQEQSPLYNFQGHLIYSFGSGIWGALDSNYYTGGRVTRDGNAADNLQQNWRVGATLSFPVNRQNSIKISGNTVVHARTESFFDTIGIAWQYRWGEGF
ncbi:MAG: transporter [Methylococcaceae bacterium]|nr:transporter [Methylococcaceae bacterium]